MGFHQPTVPLAGGVMTGPLGIGLPAGASPAEQIDVYSETDADAQYTLVGNGEWAALIQRRARAGTTSVQDTDTVGEHSAWGHDGAVFARVGRITWSVDGVPGTGSMPGRWNLSTTPTGSLTPLVRWTCRATGHFEPFADVTYDLGAAATAVRNVYALGLSLRPGTLTSLGSAATAGAGVKRMINDATAPSFGAAAVGGGAVTVPVYSDGTNWMVG